MIVFQSILVLKWCSVGDLNRFKDLIDMVNPLLGIQLGYQIGTLKFQCEDDAYCNESISFYNDNGKDSILGGCIFRSKAGNDSDCQHGQYVPYNNSFNREVALEFAVTRSMSMNIPYSSPDNIPFYCKGDPKVEEPVIPEEQPYIPTYPGSSAQLGAIVALIVFAVIFIGGGIALVLILRFRASNKISSDLKTTSRAKLLQQRQKKAQNHSLVEQEQQIQPDTPKYKIPQQTINNPITLPQEADDDKMQ